MSRLVRFAGFDRHALPTRKHSFPKPKPTVLDIILAGQRRGLSLREIADRHGLSEKVWRSALHEWLNA